MVGGEKPRVDFRNFAAPERPSVRELYRLNHAGQTLEFVRSKHAEYLPLRRARMSVWDAIERLEEIVDDSDPDTEASQLDHALQTSERLRADSAPRWLVLTGFIHDLGKVLCLFGEPQWAVVGDTFPVGCGFVPEIVYPDLFEANPDSRSPEYATEFGIYQPNCGLDSVLMSWGHDEYLYHVVREHLPPSALAIIRYHSFYAWHQEGAYAQLMGEGDAEKLDRVRRFSPYDLYTKSETHIELAPLRSYYGDLVAEFLPETLQW